MTLYFSVLTDHCWDHCTDHCTCTHRVNFFCSSYIDEFYRTAGRPEFRGTDSSDVIIGNPIQAYQLVKRLAVDWVNVQKAMTIDDWKSKNW